MNSDGTYETDETNGTNAGCSGNFPRSFLPYLAQTVKIKVPGWMVDFQGCAAWQPVEKGVWNFANHTGSSVLSMFGEFQTPFSTGC